MAKENYIKFRCSDDFKDLVEQQAKERGMTVSSYIKHLIRKDVDVMRVVTNCFITEEMEKEFANEQSCYLSSDGEYWLFTDMKFFNKMEKKYKFDEELEERDGIGIHNMNIREYIELVYEDKEADYFGYNISFAGYDETDVCEDNIECLCNNEWDKTIDAWMKTDVILEIKIEMQETLKKMLHDGYDIAELKTVVEDVMRWENNSNK